MGIQGFLQMKEPLSVRGKPGRGSQLPEQEHRCGAAWRGGVCKPLGEPGWRGEQQGRGSLQPPRSSPLAHGCLLQLCPGVSRGTGRPRAEPEGGRGCSLASGDKWNRWAKNPAQRLPSSCDPAVGAGIQHEHSPCGTGGVSTGIAAAAGPGGAEPRAKQPARSKGPRLCWQQAGRSPRSGWGSSAVSARCSRAPVMLSLHRLLGTGGTRGRAKVGTSPSPIPSLPTDVAQPWHSPRVSPAFWGAEGESRRAWWALLCLFILLCLPAAAAVSSTVPVLAARSAAGAREACSHLFLGLSGRLAASPGCHLPLGPTPLPRVSQEGWERWHWGCGVGMVALGGLAALASASQGERAGPSRASPALTPAGEMAAPGRLYLGGM